MLCVPQNNNYPVQFYSVDVFTEYREVFEEEILVLSGYICIILVSYSHIPNKIPKPAVLSLRERRDRTADFGTKLILTMKTILIGSLHYFPFYLMQKMFHRLVHAETIVNNWMFNQYYLHYFMRNLLSVKTMSVQHNSYCFIDFIISPEYILKCYSFYLCSTVPAY